MAGPGSTGAQQFPGAQRPAGAFRLGAGAGNRLHAGVLAFGASGCFYAAGGGSVFKIGRGRSAASDS